MKKIAVVGLKGVQETEVRRTHGARCSLVFIEGTRKSDRVAAAVSHADAVIALASFLDHRMTGSLRAAVGARFRCVMGGISSVRLAIDQVLA